MSGYMLYASLLWGAVIIYVAATIANVYGVLFNREKAEKLSYCIAYFGLLGHGGAIIYWWVISGHGPYLARNEVLSSCAWIMLFTFFVFLRFFPGIKPVSIFTFPAAFLLVALSQFYSPDIWSLPPTFRSIWLALHVAFYKISLATIMIALGYSVFYILKKRTKFPWLGRLPHMELIDIYAYRFAGFGFTFWAIATLAGSIWAYQSWGRFWGWDPVETWSLITWIFFGLHLHLRRFFKWRGERAAYFYIFCAIVSITAFFFISHADTSIHSEYFK